MILVIGAAGTVGKRLVQALASRGNQVIGADRNSQLPHFLYKSAAAIETQLDVRDFEALQQATHHRREPSICVPNYISPLWNNQV